MDHFIIIMHFISFTSGIILITLINFFYPKHKSPIIKYLLLADVFYTGLLLIDTIDLYTRKNISYYNEILHACFNLGQFAASAAGVYYLVRITYDLIDMEANRIKKLLYIGSVFLFSLVISLLYILRQSHSFLGEYILIMVKFFPYVVFIYCLVIIFNNFTKVKKEVKKIIYSCLVVLFIIIPGSFIANNIKNLPLFIYKIPYIPILYFLINAIGVIFIQKNIVCEQSRLSNNTSISEDEVYEVFSNKYGITERELEIVRCIAEGFSNPEIGDKLYISPNTVKNHIYNIYRKIGIKNRYELISILSQMQKPAQNVANARTL